MARLFRPDETVAILATGPSLKQEDVDFVRGRARVLAIKGSYAIAPWADAVVFGTDAGNWNVWSGRGRYHPVANFPQGSQPGNAGALFLTAHG